MTPPFMSNSDVMINNKIASTMVILHIKQSTADTLLEGVLVVLGLRRKEICPVEAVLPYMVVRSAPTYEFPKIQITPS